VQLVQLCSHSHDWDAQDMVCEMVAASHSAAGLIRSDQGVGVCEHCDPHRQQRWCQCCRCLAGACCLAPAAGCAGGSRPAGMPACEELSSALLRGMCTTAVVLHCVHGTVACRRLLAQQQLQHHSTQRHHAARTCTCAPCRRGACFKAPAALWLALYQLLPAYKTPAATASRQASQSVP
jgi:hypothetical protein